MNRIIRFSLVVLALSLTQQITQLRAQVGDYPPGTIQMTPKISLDLKPSTLHVPEKFKGKVPENLPVNLPNGFRASVFAVEGLRGPRMMAFDDQGVLHVANMKANGSDEYQPRGNSSSEILALPDYNGDGVADTVIIAAKGLRWANSLSFYKGAMYVADTHQIVKFTDNDGDLAYEHSEVFADSIPTASSPHITRTIAADTLNDRFFLSVGSSCDVCREADPERATILSIDADGTNRKVFATGVRNAIGLDIHPLTGALWATNNGHTETDNNLPPEWVDIIREDGFYGFPLAFGYQSYIDFGIRGHWRVPPITAEDSARVQQMERPVAQLDAHSAPMDIHFYPKGNFPEDYHNAAFIAYRSGFRGPDPGHKVTTLFVNSDGGEAKVADFMTGFWPNPPNQANIWAKPVGLVSDHTGALYLSSDWINHLVIKISYTGDATSTDQESGTLQPTQIQLEQNYPNPFNPTTQISYALPEATQVNLSVFNSAGQKILELVNGQQAAGQYTVNFDATGLSSGVYIYTLTTSKQSLTKKMTLIK